MGKSEKNSMVGFSSAMELMNRSGIIPSPNIKHIQFWSQNVPNTFSNVTMLGVYVLWGKGLVINQPASIIRNKCCR